MSVGTEIVLQSIAAPVTNDPLWFDRLAGAVNELIQNDFPVLIQILYRVDVNETKLKQMLAAHPEEGAGYIIASMLLERQIQKQETKKMFATQAAESEEEPW
ncbi:MAG: hypothetical protein LBE82_08545 [Chitinophagaceae bacterium]|jgi:hypothetical protein|nr:hypothetical protein [Chitinophagaceae bacterium]